MSSGWAVATVGSGLTLVIVGVGLVYYPAAIITLGVFLAVVGAFAVDVGGPGRPGGRP